MSEDLVTVLLDTNVFVAAYWNDASSSARLIDACVQGRAQAHYSRETRVEVTHILRTIRVRESYIERLQAFWDRAIEVHPVPVEGIRAADPDDQKYLEAALGGETDLVITNDDHLLSVGFVGRTQIVTPRSALKMLGL